MWSGRVTFGGDGGWSLSETRNVAIEDGTIRPDAGATTTDDFEDGDAGEYGHGSSGWFSVTTNSIGGTYGLRNTSTSGNGRMWIEPGEDLDAFPSKGDRIRWG